MDEESEPVQLPKPPVFNLPQVFHVRDRLRVGLAEQVGAIMQGVHFENTVEGARRLLNDSGFRIATIPLLNSLKYLGGRELTERLLTEFAWRIAGNLRLLKIGTAVPPWTRQTVQEWVPFQVVATRYAIKKKPSERHGRSGRTMRFRALAGTPCPMDLTQWWSNEKLDVLAYSIGFKKRPPMYKADQSEFMGMRFLGLVTPTSQSSGVATGRHRAQALAISAPAEPSFYHVNCPPSLEEHNRDLIKMRRRIGFSCPEGFDYQCHQCPRGVRSCSSATHLKDYEAKICIGCGQEQWFDTDKGFINDYCIHCQPLVSAGIPLKVITNASGTTSESRSIPEGEGTHPTEGSDPELDDSGAPANLG